MLSGSLPRGLPAETYAELVALLSDQGARVVVDASGAALSAVLAAEALPHAIKPNRHELEDWAGAAPADRAALIAAARGLVGPRHRARRGLARCGGRAVRQAPRPR